MPGLPVLGICRGMQVMAVQAGGTLEQHLPDRVGHDGHSPGPGVYGSHPVRTVPGTRVARLLGEEEVVASYHHQSVLTHPGYTAAAWADDGTLEAMEDPDARFRLAVQWHPETGHGRAPVRGARRGRAHAGGLTEGRRRRAAHIPRRRFTVRTPGGRLPLVKTSWADVATATLILD